MDEIMKFNILTLAGDVRATVEIPCVEEAPDDVKLGFAVIEAAKDQLDLSGTNLAGADLSQTTLRDVIFTDANMQGVNFQDADLSGSDFSGCDLRGADMVGAILMGSNLRGAHMGRERPRMVG